MSTIVTCQCGARLRLPEDAGDRAFRCPRCRAEVTAPVEAKVLSSHRAGAGAEAVCPICQSPIAADEPVLTCPECEQVHHRECWAEIGGCSTYGCKEAPALAKETPPADRPLTAWGDTKKCPACGETIKSIALRCRYCKTDFDTVDPLTVADLRHGVRKTENVKKLQSTVVGLFVLTLIGCLAPLMLIVSLCVVLPKRKLLAKAGPFYLVLGYSTVGLSVLYSVLMVLFLVFQR
jgi:hypothetical protein